MASLELEPDSRDVARRHRFALRLVTQAAAQLAADPENRGPALATLIAAVVQLAGDPEAVDAVMRAAERMKAETDVYG